MLEQTEGELANPGLLEKRLLDGSGDGVLVLNITTRLFNGLF